jgi:thiamine-monophosphate kinase
MESDLIAWLRERLPPHESLRLGIGDDAAVVQIGAGTACVVTVDVVSDQVDFHLDRTDPRRVGHKALAASLSDLAAMASRPRSAVVALALPRRGGLELAKQLYEGMIPLAERYGFGIAGGDTHSWDAPLLISVTAIGDVTGRGPLVRGGGQPGDQILVTGTLGGSILGKHLDFEPRVREALLLHERYDLHAAIDLSDGLAIDLARVADESGCGAVIQLASVPISEAAASLASAKQNGRSALDHALGDGEDFELLLAVPPHAARQMLADQPLEVPLTRIGELIGQPGLWQMLPDGQRRELGRAGFEHTFLP